MPKKIIRDEYTARINRVLDFIQDNLTEKMNLKQLAGIANFSPYHFHRIFSAITGEPLNKFIQRVRIEKAAILLLTNRDRPVTDIAFDCGFSGSAAFARTFRDFYGMSASEWRSGGYEEYSKNRKSYSNFSKQDGKHCKDSDQHFRYICSVVDINNNKIKWRVEMENNKNMTADVEVIDIPDMTVAYVRHIGPYKGDSELFGRLIDKLMKWICPRGLFMPPKSQLMAVYHDDPELTDEDKLRMSIAVNVPEDTEVSGEIGKMKLEGGQFAVGRFELAGDEYPNAWAAMYGGWLPESGYQPEDKPPYEIYRNDPKEHPENKCIVDICIPVKPL